MIIWRNLDPKLMAAALVSASRCYATQKAATSRSWSKPQVATLRVIEPEHATQESEHVPAL